VSVIWPGTTAGHEPCWLNLPHLLFVVTVDQRGLSTTRRTHTGSHFVGQDSCHEGASVALGELPSLRHQHRLQLLHRVHRHHHLASALRVVRPETRTHSYTQLLTGADWDKKQSDLSDRPTSVLAHRWPVRHWLQTHTQLDTQLQTQL